MINSSNYKSQGILRSFEQNLQELSHVKKMRPKKRQSQSNVSDELIEIRVINNLNQLKTAEENAFLLQQLKEDINICPLAISKYIDLNSQDSIVKCFMTASYSPQDPKAVLGVIAKIIDSDERCLESFYQVIREIFEMTISSNCARVGIDTTLRLLESSEKIATEFVYDDFFKIMQNFFTDDAPFFSKLIPILNATVKNCDSQLLRKNIFSIFPLVQSTSFKFEDSLSGMVSSCYLRIVKEQIVDINIFITSAVFHLLTKHAENDKSIDYFILFNEILIAKHEFYIPFFVETRFFEWLLEFAQIDGIKRVILRLFANFSCIEEYSRYLISSKIYFQFFELLLNGSPSFIFLEDLCLIFCRLALIDPNEIILNNQFFMDMLTKTIEIADSLHSDIFSEVLKNMLSFLVSYSQTTNDMNFVLRIKEMVFQIRDSSYPVLSDWANAIITQYSQLENDNAC